MQVAYMHFLVPDYGLLNSYQTQVAKKSWLLFLSGVRTGSPRSALANMLPAKMYIMVPIHREKGCLRENCMAPGKRDPKLTIGICIHSIYEIGKERLSGPLDVFLCI